MKRVLILNGTSFVGGHVARAFYESHEYDVEVTSGAQDEDLLWRQVRTSELASIAAQEEQETIADNVEHTANNNSDNGGGLTEAKRGLAQLPPTLRRYVTAVVPRHNDDPDEFRRRLLNNDVIVAVLEDDTYEAECALRILRGTYFDVEKTFVLVSSTLTWAHTILSERAKLRAQRRRERAEERAAYRRDYGEDEELPEHLQSDNEEENDTGEDASELDGEGGVPMRTFTEAEYHARVPHPRYTPWLKLERLVKRANSATLHTYVVFAGVPYGCGEGPVLHPLLRAAWHAQELTLYGPGHNVIPMIHIRDLARIVYKLGDAYDVLEERYFFAVDRGNVTQLQLLQAVERALGGHIVPAAAPLVGHNVHVQESATRGPLSLIERLERDFGNEPKVGIAHFVSDIRATPEAVFAVHPEEEWHALDGFVANITKVCYEFRTTRQVTPVRIWLTGPPCSGASSVAARLAVRYGVPHLTRESVIAEYEAHVKSIRATLYELLLGRLLRRRTRRYERARQELEAERARLRAEAEMNDEMNDEEEENDDDGNKNTQQEGEEDDEGGEDGNDEDDEEDNPQRAVSAALSELIDTACDVASAKAKITEAYLRGPPLLDAQGKPLIEGVGDNGAEEDEEFNADEEMPEEGEDEDEDDNNENDEELTRAERRARAARAAQDLQERIHIRELRLEYRLAQRALSMKLIDGRLPRPPKPHSDDEEEEEEEESNGVGSKGRASRRNEYDDEQEEGDEEQEEEKDEAEQQEDEEDDNEEEEEEEESEEGDAQEGKGAQKKGKHNDVDGPTVPGNILYLDEAVAFFMRWRLRQHDCRNQGYVLESYPETVRQARLLFQRSPNSTGDENGDDGEEGESEEEHKRALPATTVEDVLAPLDADFAFPALHTMDEAKLRKLERAVLQRNPVYQHLIESTTADPADALIAGMMNTTKEKGEHDAEKDNDDADDDENDESDEKDILAAVDEGLFPDYVLILQRTDRQLETIAGQRSTTAYYYHHAQSLLVQPQYSGSSHTINHQYTDRSSYTNSGEAAIRRHSSQQTDMSHTMPTRRTSSNAAEVSDVRPIPLIQPKREKRSGKEDGGEVSNEDVSNTLPQLQAYRRESSVATAPDPLIDTVTPNRGFSADVTNCQNKNSNAAAGLNETGKWANTTATMQEEEKDDLRAMRPVKDVMAFYTALDYYRAHHGCGAIAPTISLVTWFQSVQTTEQRGATPMPVLPRFDPSSDAMGDEVMDRTTMMQGMEEGNAGNAEEVNATRWAPSSTARTARVLTLQLPPPYITPALQAAFEAGTSCVSGTVTPFHTSPATSPVTRTETTTTTIMPSKTPLAPTNETDAIVRTSEEILEDFADRLCSAETDLLPVPHVYGPMSAQLFDSSSPAERARLRREKALIQELLSKEAVMRSEAEQQVQAKLQEERRVLRGMQVRHGCLDVTQAHKMPMEQYLMEYVLPSLTPVLAEVVKVRPDDPVTTLADLLYQHKRRLSL